MSDGVADAHALLRQAKLRAEQQRTDAQRLSDRIARLRVTGSNSDGSVTITVDSNGGLCGLKLSDAAMKHTAEELCDEIMLGARATQRAIASQAEEAAKQVYGSDSKTAAMVRDQYERLWESDHDDEKR